MSQCQQEIGKLSQEKYDKLIEQIPKQIILEIAAKYIAESRGIFVKDDCVTSPEKAKNFIRALCFEKQREEFTVVFLDNQHQIIDYKTMFYGTINSAAVYPREVAKAALEYSAAALILIHNHPSGIVEPSNADRRITRQIVDALNLHQIRLLDHFICGGKTGEITSFAERGFI